MNKYIQKFLSIIVGFALLVALGAILAHRKAVPSLKIVGNEYLEDEIIVVEVNGKVAKPGEYSVPKSTMLHDVIYMAGGILPDGNPESVELGKILTESCTVTIDSKSRYDSVAESVITDPESGKYNINIASASQLQKLKGIGEGLATDIVNYRTVYGDFESIEDIKNVKGIGQKKFEAIKDLITVGGN